MPPPIHHSIVTTFASWFLFFFFFFIKPSFACLSHLPFDTFRINPPSRLYQVVLILINQFDFLEFWIFALLGCWPVLNDLITFGPRLPHYSLSCRCIDFLFLQQFGLGLVFACHFLLTCSLIALHILSHICTRRAGAKHCCKGKL